MTYGELNAAFDAIEKFLKKYYVLLLGGSLMNAEPTPQFNTYDLYGSRGSNLERMNADAEAHPPRRFA